MSSFDTLEVKVLPDGRRVDVIPLTFGRARICVAPTAEDRTFYSDAFEYDDPIAAVVAAVEWDGTGEPAGWMRHPASGRRRPDGDPGREYVHH